MPPARRGAPARYHAVAGFGALPEPTHRPLQLAQPSDTTGRTHLNHFDLTDPCTGRRKHKAAGTCTHTRNIRDMRREIQVPSRSRAGVDDLASSKCDLIDLQDTGRGAKIRIPDGVDEIVYRDFLRLNHELCHGKHSPPGKNNLDIRRRIALYIIHLSVRPKFRLNVRRGGVASLVV